MSSRSARTAAAVAMACAREAGQDGVVAVFGRADVFSVQSSPVLEKAGVPDGLIATGTEAEATNRIGYPLHSGNFGAFLTAPYAFAAAGKSRMAVVTVDISGGRTQADLAVQAAAAAGIENVGVVTVPVQGVTDYAPYVQGNGTRFLRLPASEVEVIGFEGGRLGPVSSGFADPLSSVRS